jgi:hypothetical protein
MRVNGLCGQKSPRWLSHAPSIIYYDSDLRPSKRIAAFDLDGTLVQWKVGKMFSLSPDSWHWLRSNVPDKLRVRRFF